MVTHRIRQLRELRGLSQERLGVLIGRSKSVISRLEDGTTRLDIDVTKKIAKALDVSVAEVLGIETNGGPRLAPAGLAEDIEPYMAEPGDPLAPLATDNRALYTVKTNAVQLAGIGRGDVVVMNESADACRRVKPLDVVRVLYHPPESPARAIELLRQYVPPRKLITNSATHDAPSLDTQIDDAHIVAVVESVHRRFLA
jgi:transcriptional regulator with XRE-family HTH domain